MQRRPAPALLVLLALPAVAVAVSAARRPVRAPRPAEVEALWGGGRWTPDRFRMGSWMSGFKTSAEYTDPNFIAPNMAPLKPEPLKVYKNIRAEMGKGRQIFGPYAQCHPAGLPYRLSLGYYEAVVSSREIDFLYGDQNYRRIFMDGRRHPPPGAEEPTYYGHSVGRWEGRTLVVDTVNIRGSNTQIEPHIPKAEGSRLVERYTPAGRGVMKVEFTFTNPDLTRPWTVKFNILRQNGRSPPEDICTDGNRYAMDAGGELTMHGNDGKPLEKAEP